MKHTISADRRTLTIAVTESERAILSELPEVQSDKILGEVFEPLVCNSELQWINPADTGDLTSAPMLGILGEESRNNSGPHGAIQCGGDEKGGFYQPILERWAFMQYQVVSVLETLRDKGECIFIS